MYRTRPNRTRTSPIARGLIAAARRLSRAVEQMEFGSSIGFVYNPLRYAWRAHEAYLLRFGGAPKRVVFLGMNPGPFGMVQTGVPFGEVASVRSWLGISADVARPAREHPKRPIEGFACRRSEVSGRRLWELFAARFERAERFFQDHFVANYCPLAFLEPSGRNLTPDKLPAHSLPLLHDACDQHLRQVVELLQPEWVIAVGDFAERRARAALTDSRLKIGRILHPSPASPAANRDWAGQAAGQMIALGVWTA